MKNTLLTAMLCFSSSLTAVHTSTVSDEFVEYHLKMALEEIEDIDMFNLIQENVNNLRNAGTCKDAANELICIIDQGCIIDAFNMSKLIETLDHANALNSATRVIIYAIEHDSPLTFHHRMQLLDTMLHANPCSNAAKILIRAIELGIEFGLKERQRLAEVSNIANARKDVEKIRKALNR